MLNRIRRAVALARARHVPKGRHRRTLRPSRLPRGEHRDDDRGRTEAPPMGGAGRQAVLSEHG
jgi:hypothetical protein